MDLYQRFIELVDANIIYCLIPMVLTLFLIELIFKNRFETKKALNLIRWLIIFYTSVSLLYFLIGVIVIPKEFAFVQRATGPYKIAYWMMFLLANILPFTLLIKKLSSNFLYVILIAFCLKTGVFFEHFVLIVTSLHRDYPSIQSGSFLNNSLAFAFTALFLQGLIIAIITLGIFDILKQRNHRLSS